MKSLVSTLLGFLFLALSMSLSAQPTLVDEIVAVVGDEIILYSDVQIQKNQLKQQGVAPNITDCEVLEELLFEKLLLHQAKVDSIEVDDAQVETELDKRLNVFIRQIGSEKALEEYYGKSMEQIREEFFTVLKDQMLVQRMEAQIAQEMNVTPKDVKEFYEEIPRDSLPFVSSSVEMAQIVAYPEVELAEVEFVRKRLRSFKDQVEKGQEDFETLAALYSDDPGSASKGGNLGMKPRGTFVPEFDAVAFNLEEGEISAPFKTDYGYHIMQMLERRGEMYNANHILLIPAISASALNAARDRVDSVRTLLLKDSLSFAFAAVKYSDDERTKNQNGMLVNPASGSTIFQMDQLDPTLFMAIDTLAIGQISQPTYFEGASREKGYRIIKLINRTEPHRANLREDYQSLQAMATEHMRARNMDSWVRRHIDQTYIKIGEKYASCDSGYPWMKNLPENRQP